MKKCTLILIFVLVGFSFFGCKKSSSDSNSNTGDLATMASGTYTGTANTGGSNLPCSIEITRQSSTSVTLKLLSEGMLIINAPNTTVSNGGGQIVNLQNDMYYISGTVNGKSLDFYLSTMHVVGTKP
jgi:hypothetical protein